MPDVNGFLPSTHSFHFDNDWPAGQADKVIHTVFGNIAIGDSSNGLCGGMVYAVRDYFESRIPIPTGRRPVLGQPLYDFIVDRLFASFDLPNGPTKYYDWMTTADHDTWIKTGLAHRTILEEWPRIKADIDANRLSCIALVTIFSLNPGDMGQNHQVMVYGYDLDANQNLTLKIYDPNSLLSDNVRISLNLSNPAHTTPITHNVNIAHPIRGFFHCPYMHVNPPQIDDAEIISFLAPSSMLANATGTVNIRVQNTGTTTWTSGGPQPYRLGTQRPQDNTVWGVQRVELPRSIAPTQTVDFSIPIKAPAGGGIHPMGWRMVHELVQWFGEMEERGINVIAPISPATPCDQLRDEILATLDDIHALQEDLRTRAGAAKAFIAAQIRKKQAELTKLRNDAKAKNCPTIP